VHGTAITAHTGVRPCQGDKLLLLVLVNWACIVGRATTVHGRTATLKHAACLHACQLRGWPASAMVLKKGGQRNRQAGCMHPVLC
jgi:hypothetical protein